MGYQIREESRTILNSVICWNRISLNDKFKGCEAHHIDMEHVIHIPFKLHKTFPHTQSKPESMKKINWEAFKFLMNQMMF
jgi:hypothetical protein